MTCGRDVSRPHEAASASRSALLPPLSSPAVSSSTGKDEVDDSLNMFCHLNL